LDQPKPTPYPSNFSTLFRRIPLRKIHYSPSFSSSHLLPLTISPYKLPLPLHSPPIFFPLRNSHPCIPSPVETHSLLSLVSPPASGASYLPSLHNSLSPHLFTLLLLLLCSPPHHSQHYPSSPKPSRFTSGHPSPTYLHTHRRLCCCPLRPLNTLPEIGFRRWFGISATVFLGNPRLPIRPLSYLRQLFRESVAVFFPENFSPSPQSSRINGVEKPLIIPLSSSLSLVPLLSSQFFLPSLALSPRIPR
ncbi:hypothetical protein J437_LFUL003366, partial [Ladona fulva]